MDNHFVIMSTGNLYPCECASKVSHPYSDTSMAEIVKHLAKEITGETAEE